VAQLTEHLSKGLLERFNLPIGSGELVDSSASASAAAARAASPVAVKAQIPVGSRGRSGAIIRAEGPTEAAAAFDVVTGISVDGLRAREARVEPWQRMLDELYLAVSFDSILQAPVLLFSRVGGTDVESHSESLRIMPIPIEHELSFSYVREHADLSGLASAAADSLAAIAHDLIHAFFALEARTIELNPLGQLENGEWIAVDARVILDDNALFRHPDLQALVDAMSPRRAEDIVRETTRLEFVPLDGAIAVISGGAGMTMAVMDLIADRGAAAACFLDCSADVTPRGYRAALDLVLNMPQITSILVSVFGGLTRVDRVASTFIDLLAGTPVELPLTFRLMGTNLREADDILASAGLDNHHRLEAAVDAAVRSGQRSREVAP